MQSPVRTSLFCALALFSPPGALTAEFLDKRTSVNEIKADLELTLEQVLSRSIGAGARGQSVFLAEIESQLAASFKALPKNHLGLLDQPALHHLVSTRFVKENGWYVKGLEPQSLGLSEDINETVGILKDRIPLYIEQLLGSRNEGGFGLHDAVAMVATLEHIIVHDGVELLDAAYRIRGFDPNEHLDQDQIGKVLDSYMVLFLLGGNPTDKKRHLQELEHITKIFPAWVAAQMFFRDIFQETLFSVSAHSNPFTGDGGHLFEVAWKALDRASRIYGKFQNHECQDMKEALTAMDPEATGRVKIRDFYGKLFDGSYPFSESPEYLRNLGALDESAPGRGPQVIIPNYLNSLNNCIMSGAHYAICCVNECIGLMNNIEARVAAPSAEPAEILAVVEHMSSSTVQAPRNVSEGLRRALVEVAALHSGKVPLHGRLFAQWIHYAFPQECPYPHTSASGVESLTPAEYQKKTGSNGFVTTDVFKQVLESRFSGSSVQMSQWTMEEELHIGSPHDNVGSTILRRLTVAAVQILVIVGLAVSLWDKVSRARFISSGIPKSREYLV